MVGASILVTFSVWGALSSFGVFFVSIIKDLNWTRAITSGAMSVAAGVNGLVSVVAGRLADKYSARMIIACGALIGGLGYLLMFNIHYVWQLYLFFGVMIGVCSGACWAPIIANVSAWFTEKRVLAVGVTTTGITLGQMIIPPLAANFNAIYEWRSAYVIMAVMIWVTALPAIIFINIKPSRSSNVKSSQESGHSLADVETKKSSRPQGWSALEAVKTNSFWALMVTGFATATGFYFIQVHVIAYATDMKIASTSAAFILTFLNIGSMVAQLLGWAVTSRIGSRQSVIIFITLMALAMFLLMVANSLWILFALGAVFGLGFGGCTTVRMSMIAEFFGMKSLGIIVGLVTTSWAVGGIVGPILAGYIFDISRSYYIAFLIGGSLLTVGVFAGFFLKAPREKHAQLELSK